MMSKLVHYLFIAAALLALAASLYILLFGGGTLVTDTAISSADENPQQTIERISWFRAQGWWGVAVLGIYAALYYAPLHFYRRDRLGAAAVFGVSILGLTWLAGFSIGPAYWPAAGALLLGLVVMGVTRAGRGQPAK